MPEIRPIEEPGALRRFGRALGTTVADVYSFRPVQSPRRKRETLARRIAAGTFAGETEQDLATELGEALGGLVDPTVLVPFVAGERAALGAIQLAARRGIPAAQRFLELATSPATALLAERALSSAVRAAGTFGTGAVAAEATHTAIEEGRAPTARETAGAFAAGTLTGPVIGALGPAAVDFGRALRVLAERASFRGLPARIAQAARESAARRAPLTPEEELAFARRVLNVPRNATDEQIRQAFRQAARRFHPDAPGGDSDVFRIYSDAAEIMRAARRAAPEPTAAAGRGALLSREAEPQPVRAAEPVEQVRSTAPAAPAPAEPRTTPLARLRRRAAEVIDPDMRAELERTRVERDVARRAAEIDEPTGLGNKAAFSRALPTAEADPEAAVVLFDLENLKALNDKVSMQAGDAAIRRAADAIAVASGRGFRIGGDEFAVIAPATEADALARRILDTFGELDAAGFPVRLRFGIGASMPDADAAVRAAKSQRTAATYRTSEHVANDPAGGILPDSYHASTAPMAELARRAAAGDQVAQAELRIRQQQARGTQPVGGVEQAEPLTPTATAAARAGETSERDTSPAAAPESDALPPATPAQPEGNAAVTFGREATYRGRKEIVARTGDAIHGPRLHITQSAKGARVWNIERRTTSGATGNTTVETLERGLTKRAAKLRAAELLREEAAAAETAPVDNLRAAVERLNAPTLPGERPVVPSAPPINGAPVGPRAPQHAPTELGVLRLEGRRSSEGLRDTAAAMGLPSDGPLDAVAERIVNSRSAVDGIAPAPLAIQAGLQFTAQQMLGVPIPARAAGEAAAAINDIAFIDVIDRLRKVSDDPRVQRAADAARRATDTAKSVVGELNPSLRKLLPLLGAAPATPDGKALASLQQIVWDDAGATGVSRWRLALENKLPAAEKLTARERAIIEAVQSYIKTTGRLIEREGIRQFNHRTGEWEPFAVRGRDVAPRMPTLFYYDLLMQGEGARFDALVNAIAQRNGLAADDVRATLRQQRAEMLGLESPASDPTRAARRAAARADEDATPADAAARAAYEAASRASSGTAEPAFRRINAEHTRVWNEFPEYVTDPLTGRRVNLLEANPFRYVERLTELTASRIGYVRHFGQEIDGDSLVNELVEIVRDGRAGTDQLLAVTRALNGMPVEQSFYTQPGSALNELGIALNAASSVLKSGALSLTFVPNAVEPMGNIQALAGGPAARDFWVALWNLYSGAERRAATTAALEELGAVSLWVRNLSWDPQRPGESLTRIVSEAPTVIVRSFWRSQERLAAAVGLAKAERMRAGKGTAGDVADARALLNLPRQEARALARGKGTPEQYHAIARRAGAFTTNSPMARAEMARIEHSRAFKAAFAFTRYAMMKVRWLGQYGPVVMDDLKALHSAHTAHRAKPTADTERAYREAWQEAAGSTSKVARMLAGTTASGAASYFLMALVTGGMLGLSDTWEEFSEEPMRFLRESFLYTMLAGPLGAILRTTQDQSRAWYESVVRTTWPGALAVELTDFANGSGRYRDRDYPERIGRFVERFLPVNRAIMQGLAALGYRAEEKEMQTAIRAYWKHARRIDPQGRYTANPTESIVGQIGAAQRAHAEYRRHMRRAADAIMSGRDPQPHVDAALAVDGKDRRAVAANIRSRKLLTGALAEVDGPARQALAARTSDRTMRLLEHHDAVLDWWAQAVLGSRPLRPQLPERPFQRRAAGGMPEWPRR